MAFTFFAFVIFSELAKLILTNFQSSIESTDSNSLLIMTLPSKQIATVIQSQDQTHRQRSEA